jgi:hypothetical protein
MAFDCGREARALLPLKNGILSKGPRLGQKALDDNWWWSRGLAITFAKMPSSRHPIILTFSATGVEIF